MPAAQTRHCAPQDSFAGEGSEAQRYRTVALGGRRVAVGRFGSAAGAGFVEVAVEGGAGDAQQVGDLLHGVLAGVVELLCVPGLRWAEGGAPAAGAAAGSGGGQAVAGVGDDELALEFGQDREHAEHGAAFGGGGVDALFEHPQLDAAVAQGGAEGDQVQYGAAEPVQAGHDEGVAGAQVAQEQVELWTAALAPLARSR